MKCPQCAKNHQKKNGQVCTCGYHFALNPAQDYGWADGRFLAIIRRASAVDTLYFTEEQLYAAYCRRLRGHGPGCWLVFTLVVAGLGGLLGFVTRNEVAREAPSPLHFILGILGLMALVGIIGFLRSLTSTTRPPSRRRFDKLLDKWVRAKGPPEKMLRKPGLHEPPPEWREPDLYDYGVERLLIVERPLLVDLLVRNGLHARERMLVISPDGYPDYLMPRVRELLARQTDLPVFLLHDATEVGVRFAESPAVQALLGPTGHTPTDLGLFPEDVPGLQGLRPLKPKRADHRVPVDALSMLALSAVMTDCLAGAMPIRRAAEQRAAAGGDGGGGYG